MNNFLGFITGVGTINCIIIGFTDPTKNDNLVYGNEANQILKNIRNNGF